MRTHRLVRFLGDRVATASKRVASEANERRAGEEGLTADDPHGHVRRALPRAVADAIDGATRGRARLRATTVTTGDGDHRRSDLGVVFHAAVPSFEHVAAMVGRTVDAAALHDPEHSLAESRTSAALDRLLSHTADAFVFVVTEERVQVVPAQAVAALTDPGERRRPHRALYTRQLGRTFEEFAEGFVGDGGFAPSIPWTKSRMEVDRALGAWGSEHDLGRVLAIQVTVAPSETETTLQAFVE